jgi:hypothetical protein
MNTRVWSAMAPGFVRKKKARVRWNRESEVMIVAAEMRAILKFAQVGRNAEDVDTFKYDLVVSRNWS